MKDMKCSHASIIMFIVLIIIYALDKDDKYQLYSFMMLTSYYITKSIEDSNNV